MKPTRGIGESPPLLRRYCEDPTKTQSWKGLRGDAEGRTAYIELSEALIAAQRGLCCYCEINLIVPLDRQIEHVLSREQFPDKALDPANILAGCVGGSQPALAAERDHYLAPPKGNLICGQKKLNAETLDPRTLPIDVPIFVVATDGRMVVDTAICDTSGIPQQAAYRARDVLGLNAPRLVNARKKIMEQLSEAPVEPLPQREFVAREQLLPDATGKLMPWFTTRRSHFGAVSEKILAEPPQDWIGRS